MPYEISIFEVDGNESRVVDRRIPPVAVLQCETPSQLGREMAQAFKRLVTNSTTVGPLYAEGETKRRLTKEEEWEVWQAGCSLGSSGVATG